MSRLTRICWRRAGVGADEAVRVGLHDDRLLSRGGKRGHGLSHDLAERGLGRLQRYGSRTGRGRLDEVGDDAAEMAGLAFDHRDQVVPVFLAEALPVLGQQLGVSLDGGERGAQFVGDRGDQVVALLLDDLPVLLDGHSLAGDDEPADEDGGPVEQGIGAVDLAEGQSEEGDHGCVRGHQLPPAGGAVGRLGRRAGPCVQVGSHQEGGVAAEPQGIQPAPIGNVPASTWA